MKKFTLVTTCWNEISSVKNWRKNIQNQSKSPDEIIIVDNFSNDGTYEFLKEWGKKQSCLKVIQKTCSVAKGRNIAIRNAKFPYIISTDMGVRLKEDWLEMLSLSFEKKDIDVVIGAYMNDPLTINTYWAKVENFINNGGVSVLKKGFLPSNRSIAYKKSIWEDIGGYPEDLTCATDDTVFGMELYFRNVNINFQQNAIAYWKRHNKLSEFCKEKYNYGRGNGEANINKKLLSSIIKYNIPLFCSLYSLKTIKRSLINSFNALIQGKLLYIPGIFIFNLACSYYYAKGYKWGNLNGKNNCTDTRKRITEIAKSK